MTFFADLQNSSLGKQSRAKKLPTRKANNPNKNNEIITPFFIKPLLCMPITVRTEYKRHDTKKYIAKAHSAC
jgi:hypothetical protein